MYYMTTMKWNFPYLDNFKNTYTKWLGFGSKKTIKDFDRKLENALTDLDVMPESVDYDVTEHKGKICISKF